MLDDGGQYIWKRGERFGWLDQIFFYLTIQKMGCDFFIYIKKQATVE